MLFDLGGVVFRIDFRSAFEHWAGCAGVSAESIMVRYRVDHWYEQHEKGEIDATEYFDALRRTLEIDISDEEFAAGWNAIFHGEFSGAFELFQALASRIPIYAFSNSNVMHQRHWEIQYAKTLGLFREVYVSCDLGLRKPEVAAFRHVSESMGTDPERILFFDDTPENVDGARQVGMSAVRVREFADIHDRVQEFLG